MKLKFIINPVAENGTAGKGTWPKIKNFFETRNVPFSMEKTLAPGDGTLLAKKAVEEGFATIIAVGGDGTASEVVNGIVGSDVTFGIIPCGEGNDFAKVIGLSRMNLKASCETILDGFIKKIDIGIVNGRHFYNMVGIGIDAEVAELKEKTFNFLHGFYAYLALTIPMLFLYKPKRLKIKFDGASMESNVLWIVIGNGKYSGGGFKFTPLAKIDDGLFDVCLAQYPGIWYMIRHFSKIPKGRHIHLPVVFNFKVSEINIASDITITAHVDGEIIKERNFNIKILPRALKMIVKKPV